MESGTLTRTPPKQDVVYTDAPASTTFTAPVNAPVPTSNNADVEDQIIKQNLKQRATKEFKKHQIHFE